MRSLKGKFIVIEGSDGSGKGTQFKLLKNALQQVGYTVTTFDFPQYGEPSAYFVEQYLNGNYGSLDEVGPLQASLFYAMDRFSVKPKLEMALSQGHVVLCNRYVGSNMAHQGAKFEDPSERAQYFQWNSELEFETLGIPEPDLNIVLTVPAKIAQGLIDLKERRSYTDKTRDIHEADLHFLERSVEVYKQLTQDFPDRFTEIDCVIDGILLKPDAIHEMIVSAVTEHEEAPKNEKQKTSDYVTKNENGSYSITDAGRKALESSLTNLDSDVYAFNGTMDPMMVSAAMARLSRRGDDMRVTLLDEFVGKEGKDANLLKRVITAYGDDSVQQLTGVHFVVENASNLLTKKLEWGRLAAYLEQSTRYIYFDQKDEHGYYKYYTPTNFDEGTSLIYQETMDSIFDAYSTLVHKLTDYVRANDETPESERDGAWKGATRAQACDAARPVLPVATKSTVGIFASGQALESLVLHLQSEELVECKSTGDSILKEARNVVPAFLERADKPDRGGAFVAYKANTRRAMKDLADEHLPSHSDDYHSPAKLVDINIRNELDLVPYMLYEQSTRSLDELKKETSTWPISRKIEVFHAYMGERLNRRHKPGRALEHLHYTWDIVCDYGIFRDLQRHRMVDGLEWQYLSPRYGYDIPELVIEAGLTDLYEACFDLSFALFSRLQALGLYEEAQYATLMGHKMRWKIMYNAREAFHFHELRTAPQGHPGYRKLVGQMHQKVSEIHPMLAEAMIFVNKDEDPGLTRLAAERYTQFKLQQL